MPWIKGIPGPYRRFFTSFDGNEPAHVQSAGNTTLRVAMNVEIPDAGAW
jgi:hypothetical protein